MFFNPTTTTPAFLCLTLLLATSMLLVSSSSASDDVGDATTIIKSIDELVEQQKTMVPPYFGAKPLADGEDLTLHRRGWETCLRCGGAERLGAVLNITTPLQDISAEEAFKVVDAVRAYGVIVIPNQNLS